MLTDLRFGDWIGLGFWFTLVLGWCKVEFNCDCWFGD